MLPFQRACVQFQALKSVNPEVPVTPTLGYLTLTASVGTWIYLNEPTHRQTHTQTIWKIIKKNQQVLLSFNYIIILFTTHTLFPYLQNSYQCVFFFCVHFKVQRHYIKLKLNTFGDFFSASLWPPLVPPLPIAKCTKVKAFATAEFLIEHIDNLEFIQIIQ